MTDKYYVQLADALDRLPNGFPKTQSKIEMLILKRSFHLRRHYSRAGYLARWSLQN